jgi:hypothetical protein
MSSFSEILTGLVNAANIRMQEEFEQLAKAEGLTLEEWMQGREGSLPQIGETIACLSNEVPTLPDGSQTTLNGIGLDLGTMRGDLVGSLDNFNSIN